MDLQAQAMPEQFKNKGLTSKREARGKAGRSNNGLKNNPGFNNFEVNSQKLSRKIEQAVQKLFREGVYEITTTEIVKTVFPSQWQVIESVLNSEFSTKHEVHQAKALKAKLHRKVIYYLNKLVEEGLLRISKLNPRGEKVFTVSRTQIQAGKPQNLNAMLSILTPTKYYEDLGIVQHHPDIEWVSRVHSVVLNADLFESLTALNATIQHIAPAVNDTIAINNFQTMINTKQLSSLQNFLVFTNNLLRDYNQKLSLIMNVSYLNVERFNAVLKTLSLLPSRVINIVLKLNHKSMSSLDVLLSKSLKLFMDNNFKLNIHNANAFKGVLYPGRAGVYALHKNVKNALGVVSSATSIGIDVKRFTEKLKTFTAFRKLSLAAAKTLLLITSIQFKTFKQNIKRLQILSRENPAIVFSHSKSYVRLWNYDWEGVEKNNLLDLMLSVRETLKIFARSEEMIYKSCGLPMKFNIGLSSAFKTYKLKFLSKKHYFKQRVYSLKDLTSPVMKNFLRVRERLINIFEGADRVRIFHASASPEKIFEEVSYLTTTTNLPLISFDFTAKPRDLKLTQFLNHG